MGSKFSKVKEKRQMPTVRFTLKYGDKTKEIQQLKSKNLADEVLEITENKLSLSSLICSHGGYDENKLIICGFLRLSVNQIPSDDLMNLMVDYYYIERRVSTLIPLQHICHSPTRIKDGDTIIIRQDTTPDDEMFNIFVRTCGTHDLDVIKVKYSSTIKDIKRSMNIEQWGNDRCVLVFREWPLRSDEMNMIECGIAPGNTLFLLWRYV